MEEVSNISHEVRNIFAEHENIINLHEHILVKHVPHHKLHNLLKMCSPVFAPHYNSIELELPIVCYEGPMIAGGVFHGELPEPP